MSRLIEENPETECAGYQHMRGIVLKPELEKSSMKDISSRNRLSENSPPMTTPLVEQLGCDGMTDSGDKILLETLC